MTPDWTPFLVMAERTESPRSIDSPEGVGDRLRAAGFAELQALHAFRWAANRYESAPDALRTAWRGLADAEERHLGWLLKRMAELAVDPRGRAVSTQLWYSLVGCASARDFAHFMANAEDRGRKAGERFHQQLLKSDPVTAKIFGKIAEEEVEHIRLASRYFPEEPNPLTPRAV